MDRKRTCSMCPIMGVVVSIATAVGVLHSPANAQEVHSLDDISFLTGCWAGEMGSLTLREHWTEPEGGVMLGTTRFFHEGSVVDWEFGRFVEDESGVTLWPYPRGTISEHGFPLVRIGEELVFENLEHDFPVRIIYARGDDDELRPRIEGRDGESRGWSLRRAPCPG